MHEFFLVFMGGRVMLDIMTFSQFGLHFAKEAEIVIKLQNVGGLLMHKNDAIKISAAIKGKLPRR